VVVQNLPVSLATMFNGYPQITISVDKDRYEPGGSQSFQRMTGVNLTESNAAIKALLECQQKTLSEDPA
jgi:hypothetical protein